MRVVIAGGGIGGLTAALMLHDRGIDVELLEAVTEPRPLGVGINLLPHATAEFADLGILRQLAPIGVSVTELCYFNRHGQLILREPRGVAAGHRSPQLAVHRGRLQLALLDMVKDALGLTSVHLGHRVESFRQRSNSVELVVRDRVSDNVAVLGGDVLIGADGIHSTVRRHLYPDEAPPHWSGELLWRATSRSRPFLTGQSMVMIGSRRRKFVAYPLSGPGPDGEATVNWIATVDHSGSNPPTIQDWNRPGKLEDFLPGYANWRFDWLDVPRLITAADRNFEFPMVDRDPILRWSFGRISLLGDAAHPMFPIGSNGASQAILDARSLSDNLTQTSDPEAGLAAYDLCRRPATSAVVLTNREHGAARVLDLAEKRAPDGFDDINDVFSIGEREQIAASYRRVAGFEHPTPM